MNIRAALVDDMRAESTINSIVQTRVFDYFYEFENFKNSKANNINKFPAIVVEQEAWDNELNLDGHNNIKRSIFRIIVLHSINNSKLRSRSQIVRDKERDNLRVIDNLTEIIISYLNNKLGTLGAFNLLRTNIESVIDSFFEIDDNSEIITKEISYNIVYE